MSPRKRNYKSSTPLQIINQNAAGIDLGSDSHWVCLPGTGDNKKERIREFPTDTTSLIKLAEWLEQAGVTTVAMESTSVYWIPLYELLASRDFEVVLTDTRKLSSVPGRKTDILDCQWIQQLHACGLLSGAFRPGDEIVQFRSLARMQTTLVKKSADWLRRIQKQLDMMNIRVHKAVSDITGVTGMRMLHAIVEGERDPARLANMRDRRCDKNREEIERELTGNWRDEHLFNLSLCLDMYQQACKNITKVERQVEQLLEQMRKLEAPAPAPIKDTKAKTMVKRGEEPLRQALYRMAGVDLTRIDAIGVATAQTILSEIGPDLTKFPTEKQFVSYLMLSPSMAVSGGKAVRGKKKPLLGCNRVREAFRMAALAARNTDTALGAYARHVAIRRGAGVAIFATARKLAQYVYRMLKFGTDYVDIGVEEYEKRCRAQRTRALKSRAKQLGYQIIPVTQPTNA